MPLAKVNDGSHAFGVPVNVQFLEQWQGSTSERVDAFAVETPCTVDLLKLAPFSKMRDSCRVWESGVSDVQGCLALRSPKPIDTGHFDPLSDACPTVVVLQRLQQLGWKPGRRRIAHMPADPHETRLSFRRVTKALGKPYYQCLLECQVLHSGGCRGHGSWVCFCTLSCCELEHNHSSSLSCTGVRIAELLGRSHHSLA